MALIFDAHYSHVSLELIKLARDNIHLLSLPSNTTHMQPSDLDLLAVLKKHWRKILKDIN